MLQNLLSIFKNQNNMSQKLFNEFETITEANIAKSRSTEKKHLKPFSDSEKNKSKFDSRRSSSASDYFFHKKNEKAASAVARRQDESYLSTLNLNVEARLNRSKTLYKNSENKLESVEFSLSILNLSDVQNVDFPSRSSGDFFILILKIQLTH
jgi:hypothetical protein